MFHMEETRSQGGFDKSLTRRSLIQFGGTVAGVSVAGDVALSPRFPTEVIVCWSGWRKLPTSTAIMAWFTCHVPVTLHDPKDPRYRPYFQHFVSFVQREYPDPKVIIAPRVQGYFPGEDFLIYDAVQVEDSRRALQLMAAGGGWESILDEVFTENKRKAAEALVSHVRSLKPVVEFS